MSNLNLNIKIKIVLLSLVLFFPHISRAQLTPMHIQDIEGIWQVRGTHSVRGHYTGLIEFRLKHKESLQAIRLINYTNYKHNGLKVSEAWSGVLDLTKTPTVVSYKIKKADFVLQFNHFSRDESDFKNDLIVEQNLFSFEGGWNSSYQDTVGDYQERLFDRQPIANLPMWKNQRVALSSHKEIWSFKQTLLDLVFYKFQKSETVRDYRKSEEFKNPIHKFIFDPTDYKYYRMNPDSLRVINKVVDQISLEETKLKRNAFAFSLKDKALFLRDDTLRNHIAPWGLISLARFNDDNQMTEQIPEYSSALWTGYFIAAEAMRFELTQDPMALENIKQSARGLFLLMDVPGVDGEFARTVMPNEKKLRSMGWRNGAGKYSDWSWQDKGNNDMYKGLVVGFLWAAKVVPQSESAFWDELKTHAIKLTRLNILKDRKYNQTSAFGLAAYITQNEGLKNKYFKLYKSLRSKIKVEANINMYLAGVTDWSGINLTMTSLINEIMIAELMGHEEVAAKLRENLMEMQKSYTYIQRHLVNISAYAFAFNKGTRGDEFDQDKWDRSMHYTKWGLREFPGINSHDDIYIDLKLKLDWVPSPYPKLPWKYIIEKDLPLSFGVQSLYNWPIYEVGIVGSNFVWKDQAFVHERSQSRMAIHSRVDYLFAYWLARWGGLISETE